MRKSAKEEMLARIRSAVANTPEAPDFQRDVRERDEREYTALVEDFIDRLRDYKARVTRTDAAGLPQVLTDVCQQHTLERLVMPADIPNSWLPVGVVVLRDEPPLSLVDLESSAGVLTGCALGIAQTGTIILDGGVFQGRRALSLVPDIHLCVVRREQIVGLVPEAIAKLAEKATYPLTLISGPSATSDIELSRVEGVHGPRVLYVLIQE